MNTSCILSRYELKITTDETRDCLQCPDCGNDPAHIASLDNTPCTETISHGIKLQVDGADIPEIKLEKTESRYVRGNTTCVCWLQEEDFRRADHVIGFSSRPGSLTDLSMEFAGEYRMVNSARKLNIYPGYANGDIFNNVYANHKMG